MSGQMKYFLKEEDNEDTVFPRYQRYLTQLTIPPPKYSLCQIYRHLFGKVASFYKCISKYYWKHYEQFKLKLNLWRLYQTIFLLKNKLLLGEDPARSHGAEADCLTLLKTIAVCGPNFHIWLENSTQRFVEIKRII